MDFFYSTELAIPISQMILLLFSSTLTLLFGRVRLALMINYLFTLYWGYLYQKNVLFEASLQSVLYLYIYFGFGILIALIAIVGFLRSRDWAKLIKVKSLMKSWTVDSWVMNREGMRIKLGEHMSSPPKFEDIGAWLFARDLTRKVNGRRVTLNGKPWTRERLRFFKAF